MQYSSLYELITALEYGTKLNIGVIFFGFRRSERLMLPRSSTIRTGEYCWRVKKNNPCAQKCYLCRSLSIRKATRLGKPFGGVCIHGVWEYTHPVFDEENLVCIIFIGNIYDPEKSGTRIHNRLAKLGISDEAERLIGAMEHQVKWSQCEVIGRLIESYIRLIMQADNELSAQSQNSAIADIVSFIEENLCSSLSIRSIAELFHYHEKYIGRLFKQTMGCSIRTYIYSRRIERAMMLLRETNESVIEIATRMGFENVTYFNRRFREITGITPTDYRRAVQNGDVPDVETKLENLDKFQRNIK
ncbi:MAG: helix-turn-helix domain-containing protein [Ruminococcaceae bacterium]|nr:helix-turn-helix domain-containing protein [Oscillospiraceae bacterium]